MSSTWTKEKVEKAIAAALVELAKAKAMGTDETIPCPFSRPDEQHNEGCLCSGSNLQTREELIEYWEFDLYVLSK